MRWRLRCMSVFLVCASGSCSGKRAAPTHTSRAIVRTPDDGGDHGAGHRDAPRTKRIGSACEPRDGWIPERLTGIDGSILARIPPGYVTYANLAVGIKYCMRGGEYPSGYMTARCRMVPGRAP